MRLFFRHFETRKHNMNKCLMIALFACLSVSVYFPSRTSAQSLAGTIQSASQNPRQIAFSGYNWTVKYGNGIVTGTNNRSDYMDKVLIDSYFNHLMRI